MTKKTIPLGAWIQNCHDFDGLIETVKIFDAKSNTNIKLKIQRIVEDDDIKKRMLYYLENPEKIPLSLLKGTSFKPRSAAKCNGIAQAVICGQKFIDNKKKEFTDDWTAINYIKWANVLGLIKIIEDKNTSKKGEVYLTITDLGLELCKATTNDNKNNILRDSFAKYPPVYRILSLLNDTQEGLTKYELGKNLGYKDENGFTSLNIDFLINSIENKDKKIINKELMNFEGTSDKYARGICKWLLHLGLIEQEKLIKRGIPLLNYKINFYGKKLLNTINGNSSNPQTVKRVIAGLLSSGTDKNLYTAHRRNNILSILNNKKGFTIVQIKDKLLSNKISIDEEESVIYNDIHGFINIGINIVNENNMYFLKDKLDIEEIELPKYITTSDEVTSKLNNIYNKIDKSMYDEYYSLIPLSYNEDGKKFRIFESKVMEYLLKYLMIDGKYLGGINKPDGLLFLNYVDNNNIEKKVTVLLDQKAYSEGFSLNVGQTDPMGRYIDQIKNKIKNKDNSHNWWDIEHIINSDEILYCYVSSKFNGVFEKKIDDFSNLKTINGSVITAENLLLIGNKLKNGNMTIKQFLELLRSNKEIII